MTTRPRPIPLDRSLLPGLLAVALFGIIAVTVLTASFDNPVGFSGASDVVGLGYALIGKPASAPANAGAEAVYENTESFLVALVLIAILLDAAMDGALMLARRDEGGEQ